MENSPIGKHQSMLRDRSFVYLCFLVAMGRRETPSQHHLPSGEI